MASMEHHKPQTPIAPSQLFAPEHASSLIGTEQPPSTTQTVAIAEATGITQQGSHPAMSAFKSRSISMPQLGSNSRHSSRAGSRQPILALAQAQGTHGAAAAPAWFDDLEFINDWDLGDIGDFELPDDETFVRALNELAAVDSSHPDKWQNQAYPQFPAYGQMLPGSDAQCIPQQAFDLNDPALYDIIDPSLLQQTPIPQSVEPALEATPGLTAIPGATDFLSYVPMPGAPVYPHASASHVQYTYPDPSGTFVQAPYYYSPGYQAFVPRHSLQQVNTQAPAPLYIPQQKPSKRARDDSVTESHNAPAAKRHRLAVHSESDSESDRVTRAHTRKTERRRESRESGVSSSSSIGKPNAIVARAGQKPERMDDKPWVRVNTSTRGETTRTARINGEANELRKYKSKPLPNGDSWQSSKYSFEYAEHSDMHEFKQKRMSPRQIKEYIMDYPSDDLKLWIQVSPADSARRYASSAHSKCLFRECPKHVYGENGTIEVGHYQVAFDEKFKTYGNKVVDPFDVVGYVHLYCLERFCDFAEICQYADVEVDTRVDLPREPRQAKWTMSGRPEAAPAQAFIRACKNGRLRQYEEFINYPVHQSSSTTKVYEHTVTAAMVNINVDHRTESQIKQFVERKLTPSTLLISRGDLELAMTQKKIKKSKVYKQAGLPKSFDFAAHYDDYDPVINQRIAHYHSVNERLHKDRKKGRRTKPTTTTSTKRKAVALDWSDSEDELTPAPSDLEDLHSPRGPPANRTGTRSSPRKKARVDYSQFDRGMPEASPPYPPQPSGHGCYGYQHPSNSNPTIPHSYVPAVPQPRADSLSHLFPVNQSYSIDDYNLAPGVDGVDAVAISHLLELQRRQSSITFAPRKARNASFNTQPVSEEKVFDQDDPPSMVVQGRRRSVRLSGKP